MGGWQRGMQSRKGHQGTEQEQPLPEQVATDPGQEHRRGRMWDQLPVRCNAHLQEAVVPLPDSSRVAMEIHAAMEQNATTELFTPPERESTPSMAAHTANPALAGWIPERSRLHSKFQASQGDRVRPCLKKGGGLEKTPSVYQWTKGSSQHAHP